MIKPMAFRLLVFFVYQSELCYSTVTFQSSL